MTLFTPSITIRFDGEEYRVPGPGSEEAAYYTNDAADAIDTAKTIWPKVEKFSIKRVNICDPDVEQADYEDLLDIPAFLKRSA